MDGVCCVCLSLIIIAANNSGGRLQSRAGDTEDTAQTVLTYVCMYEGNSTAKAKLDILQMLAARSFILSPPIPFSNMMIFQNFPKVLELCTLTLKFLPLHQQSEPKNQIMSMTFTKKTKFKDSNSYSHFSPRQTLFPSPKLNNIIQVLVCQINALRIV